MAAANTRFEFIKFTKIDNAGIFGKRISFGVEDHLRL